MRRVLAVTVAVTVAVATLLVAGVHPAARADEPPAAAPAVPVAPDSAPAPVPPSSDPAAAPAAPATPPALPLDRAVASGAVAVSGESPASYAEVALVLENRTREPVVVDLAGRHLEPTTRGCQRLGLAFPTTPPTTPTEPGRPAAPRGTYPITLAAGERRVVRMHTCCMDAGKPCPRSDDRFALAASPTPPAVEVALRWWVDHPTASQGFVNAAIWQRDPALLERADAGEGLPRTTKQVRSHRGVLYLVDEGALTSVDLEGVRRFHGTGVLEAMPVDGGLLALASGASGVELWRFGDTGDPPWGRVAAFGSDAPDQVLDGAMGSLLIRRGTAVDFRPGPTAPDVRLSLAVRDFVEPETVRLAFASAKRDRAVAVVVRKGQGPAGAFAQSAALRERAPRIEVLGIDLKTGKTELLDTHWNVRGPVAGPAGVFALTFAGRLTRIDADKTGFAPSPRAWERIVAVGRGRLVLAPAEGGLVAYETRSGRATPLPADATDVSLDAVTDDVVWLGTEGARVWKGPGTEAETVPMR